MPRTAHRFSRGILCCSIPALLALPALAGTPEALDHVPSDAQAVVVVPDVGELLNDINAANTVLGDMGQPMVVMMTSMLRGMPGLNLDGSLAAVLSMDPQQDDPDVVMLVPVTDFEAFTQGREAKNGLINFPMGPDQMMYVRDAGDGYAVFGEIAEQVKNYNAAGGNLESHATRLGKAGARVSDHNDIFMYVNIPQFKDLINMGLQEMEAQAEMVELMAGPEAAQGVDQMVTAMRTIVNDAASFTSGLSFDKTSGLSFDFGLQFVEGSATSSYFDNNGDASKYYGKVPNIDYFMAASYDLSGAGISKFMTEYMDWISQMDANGMMGAMGIDKMMTGVKGGIQVLGASDNVMGGLLTNTFYYTELENPKAFIDATRSAYANMAASEEMKQAGVGFEASVDEEATEINGIQAYGYSFAMDMSQMQGMNQMGGPNPAMFMQMLFGGNGPSGYIAQSGDDGLIMTLSQNPTLLSKVAKAANGENTMSSVASMQKTASLLPDNRIMEMYIAADHLANTAGPMLMMFGILPEFEPIESLPPLGMGLTADGGGVLFRTVLPIETVNKALDVAKTQMQQQMQGQNQMDF